MKIYNVLYNKNKQILSNGMCMFNFKTDIISIFIFILRGQVQKLQFANDIPGFLMT